MLSGSFYLAVIPNCRSELIYYIISPFVCQVLFSKFFELFSKPFSSPSRLISFQAPPPFGTAYLSYHIPFLLSTPFQKFFQNPLWSSSFRPPSRDSFYIINLFTPFVNPFFQKNKPSYFFRLSSLISLPFHDENARICVASVLCVKKGMILLCIRIT